MPVLKSIFDKLRRRAGKPEPVAAPVVDATPPDPEWAGRELLRVTRSATAGTITPSGAWSKMEPLLKAGASPDVADAGGETPLIMLSACRDASPLVEKLLGAGAHVEAKRQDGYTALLRAAEGVCPENMRLLLDHGADVAAVRVEPPRASFGDCEIGGGSRDVFHYVIVNRFDEPREKLDARVECMKALLERGHNPPRHELSHISFNRPHLHGLFPGMTEARALEAAVEKDDIAGVKALLASGLHPDCSNAFGRDQALFDATTKGNLEMMKVLMDAGADINLLSPQSNLTPLQRAVWASQKDAFDLLLDRGASANKLGRGTGRDILELAKSAGGEDMAEHVAKTLARHNLTLQQPVAVSRPLKLKPAAPG